MMLRLPSFDSRSNYYNRPPALYGLIRKTYTRKDGPRMSVFISRKKPIQALCMGFYPETI